MSKKVSIAVLGLGAMGSRMAANLLKAGFDVVVWNRTALAAADLVAAGVKQATTPKEAAIGADFVMAMLRDDDASRQVWLDSETGALAGMKSGSIAIESSTLTPGWIRQLGEVLSAKGVSLLEAPVSGSRPQAETGQLIYLIGGDLEVLAQTESVLKVMGTTIQYVGALGAGALVKLCTNTLLGIQVTVLAELIGILKHAGMDAANALAAVSKTSVWSPVANYLSGSMLTENFTPQFPIELIEKDFRYILEAGEQPYAPTIKAAQSLFLDAMTKGYGKENMTGVVQLFTK
jgi:3-hydroxyisobutyrate dehydrogenase and related beta-hydroxyacid dehydrogenases